MIKILKLVLGIVVSLVQALFQVVWGIAGFMILQGVSKYYELELTNSLFLDSARFVYDYANWIILIFFMYYFINDIKQFREEKKNEEQESIR